MSQVIIVSNRLPVSVSKEDGQLVFSASVGGLATGLASYVKDKRNIWVGWPGIASDDLTEKDKQEIVRELAKHHCSPVFLTRKQIDDYYNGYANGILWPLFHNLPVPKATDQRSKWWTAYRTVNTRFAEAVLSLARPNSRIWVHDYQLLLLPELLRAGTGTSSIGFFLHIPFPDTSAFSKLPEHKKLLHGVLGADLIGFHTGSYVDNFMGHCRSVAAGITGEREIILSDHVARVSDFPMGIDYEKYAQAGRTKAVRAAIKRYQKRYRGLRVIVAVDRLDPSKGLLERLKAYREFLVRNPQWHSRVVFTLVAAPSRTEIAAYKNLSKKMDSLVAEINQEFGSPRWRPVDYINKSQPFEEVTALFAVANVAFIAPLKDGMNLAAKEYIASRRKNGVLILSETAGAAEELHDALIVNPNQPETVIDALQQALAMPRRELRARLKRMQLQLSGNTVHHWAKSFVDTLQQPVPGTRRRTKTLNESTTRKVVAEYKSADKRLLLLDYDGSLVPFSNDFKSVTPPKSLLELLKRLRSDSCNQIVLISGRSAEDLQEWFGKLDINLVAEHGAAVKKAGAKSWQTHDRAESRWMTAVLPTLEKYAQLAPGSRVEIKPHSLVWHYRSTSPYHAQKYAVIIKRVLRPLVSTYGLQVFQGNKILEIKNPQINKGAAARPWLRQQHDFIFAIGDDFTDEELFAILPDDSNSIKVGKGRSFAKYRVTDARAVISLLRKFR